MQKRIYIETTIPSFYYTLRTDEDSLIKKKLTRQWWSRYADSSILTSSAAVLGELRRGTSEATKSRIDLLQGVELLPITVQIQQIERIYIDGLVMPKNPGGDALHVAIATFHRVDVLLTWNCRHIVNKSKIDFITQVNQELGLPTPELTTPEDYFGGTT